MNSLDITSTGSHLDKAEYEYAGDEQLGHHLPRHGSNLDKTEREDDGGEHLGHQQHRHGANLNKQNIKTQQMGQLYSAYTTKRTYHLHFS